MSARTLDVEVGSGATQDYWYVDELGSGGMAQLFLARRGNDRTGEHPIAIKQMLPTLALNPSYVRMFLHEAELASRIQHENVCRVYDYGKRGEHYFIAMEYLHGASVSDILQRLCHRDQHIAVPYAVNIIAQAAAGLHAAHTLWDATGQPTPVIHRDVSPGNIYVTIDGVVKVLDFGVAKCDQLTSDTRTGTLKGKPGYMCPEQLRAERLDARSDVFSLGVVLWELLTRKRLFRAQNDVLTMKAVLEAPITPPSEIRPTVPPEICAAVQRALQRNPADRFPSALAFHQALVRPSIPELATTREYIGAFVRKQFAQELTKNQQLFSDAIVESRRPPERVVPQLVRFDAVEDMTRTIARPRDQEATAPSSPQDWPVEDPSDISFEIEVTDIDEPVGTGDLGHVAPPAWFPLGTPSPRVDADLLVRTVQDVAVEERMATIAALRQVKQERRNRRRSRRRLATLTLILALTAAYAYFAPLL